MNKQNTGYFPVKMMCRLLSVSTSGDADWFERPLSARAQENAEMANKIKAVFDEEKSRVGAKRIAERLQLNDIFIGRHRVAQIMRQHYPCDTQPPIGAWK